MLARSATLLALTLGVLLSSSALAGFRTLEWDPSAGATGYKVHYGDESGNYSTTIDVTDDIVVTPQGAVRYTTTEDFDDCTTWFFAVTAYNSAGESVYSNEAHWLTPVGIDASVPENAGQPFIQGSQVPMTVSGVGFSAGATVMVEHPAWECPDYSQGTECDDFLAELRNTVRLDIDTIGCYAIHLVATIEPTTTGGLPAITGPASADYKVTVINPDNPDVTDPAYLTATFRLFPQNIVEDPTRFDINQSVASTEDRLDGRDVAWLLRLHDTCNWPGTATDPCCPPGSGPAQIAECQTQRAGYDVDYDFDGNGWIDGADLAFLTNAFFGTCWDDASGTWKACD